MNGYEKMKRLRGMKVLKIISGVTAVSMTVTCLAVATSANSVDSDDIQDALAGLRSYGVVAEFVENYSHFESNYATKDLELKRNYDLDNVISYKDRTINFTVASDEEFKDGESKYYYFGVYCGGQLIDVEYQGALQHGIIGVKFEQAGKKNFVINIPAAYHDDTIVIHKLGLPEDNGETENESQLVIVDEGVTFKPVDSSNVTKCVISDTMEVEGELFTSNKRIYVGSGIYKDVVKLSDGRFEYKGRIIANQNNNDFIEAPNASMEVDELLTAMKTASKSLANVNSAGDKTLYYEVHGSAEPGSAATTAIREKYEFIKANPDYSLLVNVYLNADEENTYTFNGTSIGTWDSNASSRILFNFIGGNPDTTVVRLGDGFRGTALAPDARIVIGSTICGAAYTPKINILNGEVHMAPYNFLNYSYSAYYEYVPEETTEEITEIPDSPSASPVDSDETAEEDVPPQEINDENGEEAPQEDEKTTEEDNIPPVDEPSEETKSSEEEPPVTTEETNAPEIDPVTEAPETEASETEKPPVTEPPAPVVTEPAVTTTPKPVVTEPPVTTTPKPVVTEPPVTTTPKPVVTEPPVTTTPKPVVTEPPVTTTPKPVVTEPPVTTTPKPVVTEPLVTTTPKPVVTEPPVTTTPKPVVTEPPVTTTPKAAVTEPPVTTTPKAVVTEPPVTTTPKAPVAEPDAETTTNAVVADPAADTTVPALDGDDDSGSTTTVSAADPDNDAVSTTVTTTEPIIYSIDEEVPLDDLIIIDEEVPLGDRPMNTGVDSHIGMFAAIGIASLMVGAGAQAYTVILKKKKTK